MMPEYDYDGRAPEIFDPRAAIKKQLRERERSDRPVVVSARGQHGGNGGHSSAAPGATSGIGSTPPQPQRDEPGDAITEADGVNSSARESETPSGEPQKGIDESSHETVPMTKGIPCGRTESPSNVKRTSPSIVTGISLPSR